MTGNEVGDGAHNFFAQDATPGHQPSRAMDGSWTMHGNSMWPDSQRIGVPIPNSKNYNVGQSDNGRGTGSHALPEAHGLNYTQSTFRPELVGRHPPSQNSNLNSYIHGYQGFHSTRNETNFLGVDSETDGHNMNSRGSSFYELQQEIAPGHNIALDSSEPSDSPVSFDFMGGQQQMSGHNTGTLHHFSRQNTMSDIHLLQQQQVFFRKMQELQRQQQIQQAEARQQQIQQVEARQQQIQQVEARQLQIQQVEARQQQIQQVETRQRLMSHIPFGGRQASDNHSPVISNGNPISQVNEVLNHHWSGELASANGSNWMHRDSPTIQGSSSGHKFSPEQGQALNFMGLVPSHVDESLYGVPISSTRIESNQDSQTPLNKSSTQKLMTSSNRFHSNKFSGFQVENSNRDGNSIFRQDVQEENIFSHASRSVENVNQVGILQRNASLSNAHERHELADPAKLLQDKVVFQSTSHTPAGLDPTEERILYGDGNIWDALGDGPSAGVEGSSLLHGTGFSGALPSLQSGSWSALMQSAVAESSSSDVGFREETNGPHFQYSEIRDSNNQIYETNAKQESILGFQQSGSRMSYQQGNKLQDSSNKSTKQSYGGRNESSNGDSLQKAVTEEGQVYGNAAYSVGSGMGVKNTSMPWALPDSYIGMGQPSCEPNGRDLNESTPQNGDLPQFHGNASSLKHPESNDQTKLRYQEMGHPGGLWRPNAISNSHVRQASSSQAGGGNSELSNIAGMSNPVNLQVNQDINQTLPQTNNVAYWKHVDSSLKKNVNEGPGKSNSGPNESPQVLESYNSNKAGTKVHEKENDGEENSFEVNKSNKSHHTLSGSLNDIARSDVDSRAFSGVKQKIPGSACRKPPVRRFQYHPMGNLNDELEPSYGGASHPNTVSEQISQGLIGQNQGHRGQLRASGQVTKNNFETDKGYLPTNFLGNRKREKGTYPGSSPKSSAPIVPTGSSSVQNKAVQSSQHMLELLQKVDQPKDNSNLLQLRPSQGKSSSSTQEDVSDGSEGHIQPNMPFVSRGFGLQLGPPSQGLLHTNELAPPQDPRKMASSLSSTRIIQEGYGLKQTGSMLNQIMPGTNRKVTAATTSLDGHALHFKRIDESSSGIHTDVSSSASLSHNAGMISPDNTLSLADASQPTRTSHSQEQFSSHVPGENILPTIGSVAASNLSKQSKQAGFPKSVPNEWVNVPRPNAPRVLQPGTLIADATPTSSSSQHLEEKDAEKAVRGPSKVNSPGLVQEGTSVRERVGQQTGSDDSDLTGKVTTAQVKEAGALLHSGSNQRDIEAFGRSLISQNYSLLHQVKAMKNPEMNLSEGDLNKLKLPDNAFTPQKLAQISESSTSTINRLNPNAVTSSDPKTLNFSVPEDKWERNVPSQAELGLNSGVPDNYSHISAQMAPSWFNKFGTMTNGQMLSAHDDARKTTTLKTNDQPFTLGKLDSMHSPFPSKQVTAMAEPSQVVNILQSSTSIPLPTESPLPMLPQSIIDTPLPVVRQKKRKTATSELIPWHNEVSQGPQNIPSISMAEGKWAKAANRLIDKVVDDAETEDVPRTKRPKRRLILTTQLMQQLFSPPSAVNLSADASSIYDSVSYSVTRLTLGDACSLSCLESDADATHANESIMLDKRKDLREKKIEHLSTITEDFISRAKKLENEFTRLDKRASVLDIRLECQDLEKFSVINRFAKFHNRGQLSSSEGENAPTKASSSSTSEQRLYLQRYVTALPMPSNVPDRVQCLSL